MVFPVLPLILISLAFVFVVFYMVTRYKRTMLCVCFGFVIVGFTLYIAGYISSGEGFANAVFAALRGIISTVRMFFSSSDFGVLVGVQGAEWLTENIYLSILLWLCYVSAVIIMYIAFISLFGRKFVDEFRLRLGWHTEVFIIKGINKNALMLGENIATHDAKWERPDDKRLVVFLLKEDDDEKKANEKAMRFSGIVQVLGRKNDFEYYLSKMGLGNKNVLVKWMRRKTKYNIILVPNNMSATANTLCIVEYAKANGIPHEYLDIFVLTSSKWDREEIIEITKEEGNDIKKRKYPYTIHIADELDIITRQMIEKHPPFECPELNFNEKGKASKNFTVLIIGFGTIGQHAFLRLVMNGQFVGSRMRAIIVDNDIDGLRDCFLHRHPGLQLCCDMDFRKIDVPYAKFFTLLKEEDNVDYVVIALSSNEINKQAALDIKLHHERKDINALPIIAVYEKYGGLFDNGKLFSFGCRDAIYKESVIIREEIDHMAKAVNDGYNDDNSAEAKEWKELDWFSQESNRASADFIPAMLKLANIEKDRMPENLLTEDNNLAETLAHTEHLRWNAFHVAMGWAPSSIEEMHQCFINIKNVSLCRKNPITKRHLCLAPWDKLDEISEAYGQITQKKEDFKEYDHGIVRRIPKYLKAAKGKDRVEKEGGV